VLRTGKKTRAAVVTLEVEESGVGAGSKYQARRGTKGAHRSAAATTTTTQSNTADTDLDEDTTNTESVIGNKSADASANEKNNGSESAMPSADTEADMRPWLALDAPTDSQAHSALDAQLRTLGGYIHPRSLLPHSLLPTSSDGRCCARFGRVAGAVRAAVSAITAQVVVSSGADWGEVWFPGAPVKDIRDGTYAKPPVLHRCTHISQTVDLESLIMHASALSDNSSNSNDASGKGHDVACVDSVHAHLSGCVSHQLVGQALLSASPDAVAQCQEELVALTDTLHASAGPLTAPLQLAPVPRCRECGRRRKNPRCTCKNISAGSSDDESSDFFDLSSSSDDESNNEFKALQIQLRRAPLPTQGAHSALPVTLPTVTALRRSKKVYLKSFEATQPEVKPQRALKAFTTCCERALKDREPALSRVGTYTASALSLRTYMDPNAV